MRDAAEAFASGEIKAGILQAIPFWVASFITGCVAVGYTRLFGYAEDLLREALHWQRWSVFILAPLCFLLAWFIVNLLAPYARGSGIPQVMAALELPSGAEHKVSALVSIRVLLTKVFSSFFMVLGGGAVGREGPTIQIAASVFRSVSRFVPASWPRLSEKSVILTGAAAGLAAAFNTPLGGIVFAIEELARIHLNFFKTALFTAVIIAGLTAQAFIGPYLYLGYPDVKNLDGYIYAGVIATAIVSGILGAMMCSIVLWLMRWKRSFTLSKSIMFIVVCALITAASAYFVDENMLGSGKELMNHVLFGSDKYVSWHTVLFRIAGPILSFNVGGAGGIFAPALSAGASVGSYFASLASLTGSNANIIILCGMVGFLTGVTRTPFTSAILVLEMTDRHSVIFHLMLAAMIANVVALVVDRKSFYEQLKRGYIDSLASVKVPGQSSDS